MAEDQQKSLWFAVATNSISTTAPGKLIPKGLIADKKYTVSLASGNAGYFKGFAKKVPAWLNQEVTASGEALMAIGLNLPIKPAQSALLLEITATWE